MLVRFVIDKVYLTNLDSTRFNWIKLFFQHRDKKTYSNMEIMSMIIDEFIKFNEINFKATKSQLKEAEVFVKRIKDNAK